MSIKAIVKLALPLSFAVFLYCSLNPVVDKGGTDTGNPMSDLYAGCLCGSENHPICFSALPGSDSGDYDIIRGEETAFNVYFKTNFFSSAPIVFTTNTDVYKDFSTCIRDAKAKSFNFLLSYSGNSSAPADSGTFYFDWAAFSQEKNISSVDFGRDQFDYSINRGESATIAINFSKNFSPSPSVFIANNSRTKDFFSSVAAVSSKAFNYNFCLSGNSRNPVDSGTFSFSWMAIPQNLKIKGIETGTGSIDYNLVRDGSTSVDIVFAAAFNDVPIVIISATSINRDMFVNTFNKTKHGASIKLNLSNNSQLPTTQGTYSFVWMAIERH